MVTVIINSKAADFPLSYLTMLQISDAKHNAKEMGHLKSKLRGVAQVPHT